MNVFQTKQTEKKKFGGGGIIHLVRSQNFPKN